MPQTPSPKGPSPLVQSLLIAMLCLIWGSTWVVIKFGLAAGVPPFAGGAIRFSIAACAMIGVVALLGRREGGEKPDPRLALSMGICQFSLSYGIVYWSQQLLPSGLVSVLWATFPLFLAIVSYRFLPAERLTRAKAMGLCVGFSGVVVLFRGDVRALGPDSALAAFVLLGSPFVVSIGTVLIKRFGAGQAALPMTRDGMFVGAALLWIAAWIAEGSVSFAYGWKGWATILYLALVGTVLAFSVFFWLMRWAEAGRLALITYATPPLALLFGTQFAGEPLTRDTLIGSGLIFLGIALARRSPRSSTLKVVGDALSAPGGENAGRNPIQPTAEPRSRAR